MYQQALNICELKRTVSAHFKGRYQQAMFRRLLDKLTTFQWWKMLRLCSKGRRFKTHSRLVKPSLGLKKLLSTPKGALVYWFWRAVLAVRSSIKLGSAKILNIFLLTAWITLPISAETVGLFDTPTQKKSFVPIPRIETGGCARSDSLVRSLIF